MANKGLVPNSTNELKRQKYRSYSPTMLTNAYVDVIDKKLNVSKAAKKYCVPIQTLRDRVLGHISIDNVKSGPPPVFDCEQEARLAEHIKDMASLGYTYTRAEMINLGSEYAVHLGIKTKDDKQLSAKWFYNFMTRWPELKIWKPKTISEQIAKATSRVSINRYFDELGKIMDKYNLKDKPECIYNVDEKVLQSNYKPPNAASEESVSSEKVQTATIIGCGNAIGQQIPPYFIFAGKRMRQELLKGATPGADGAMSETGWSNSDVFQSYLENHFIKYVTGLRGKHILLLYDGHKTHITPDIIDWADEKKVILYVLPPHTSHGLQPMDVGCFGPFARIYIAECNKFQRSHSAVINRNNMCSIACKSYSSALCPSNLQSAFRKSGIYPLDREAIDQTLFTISDTIQKQDQSEENCKDEEIHVTNDESTEPVKMEDINSEPINQEDDNIQISFAEGIPEDTKLSKKKLQKKQRQNKATKRLNKKKVIF
ncbi:hypothetical protein LOTGIDRAFT_229168 [Lottia gigantea]|uniref:DDE-1 domain-containing protein n=1 Tax=Lottia gigantea TaxID=225164 RepID=V4A2Z2_LOTGI|nr:hypothetical protein LOTGIDRAFT_229168 [Lottia gigantea]ESO89300.1 hypothetical protein LOTGIDRAFT_229168 [Lottia gigantea]